MAARSKDAGEKIDPGVIQRVVQGIRYAVSGVSPQSWFGPGQPLQPVAQEQTEGRAFDYPVHINTRFTPRGDEGVSFAQLRGLADGYDLLRLAIETRKDQIEAFEWEILPVDEGASPESMAAEIKAATDLLHRPDKEHDWPQWLRMCVEELLVIDALCVYPRRTKGGGLYGFDLVDGATIKRVLDDTGRTPLPPDVAYQQVLKGVPAGDYSQDTLVYLMRNPRVSRSYGFGPVEQIITTVNIALRRQVSQMEHYTSGNVPEALAQVPSSWTAKQIQEFQTWWDSVMEGNLAQRRKMKFIPNLDNIVFPKDKVLKDEMDEWLARIVCFALSITPAALIKQVNRASGEQIASTAKEEGLLPLLRFLSGFVTRLLQVHGGFTGLRFAWKIVDGVQPDKQATIHDLYLRGKVLTPDEVRRDLGRQAMTPAEREAAWPAPPEPIAPPVGKPAAKPGDEPPKPAAETPAEKMLADALRMLDPHALAKVIAAAAESQAPRIVEVRPEVNVDVGDTNIHVPVQRAAKD